jgi:hypothetical protein
MALVFNRYCLMLAMLPLAGCVTETRQEAMMLHAPPVSSQNRQQTASGTSDPYDLQAAISTVRQQPWCYRGARR